MFTDVQRELEPDQPKPSTLRIKNAKEAVDITLHEAKYEKQLEELRLWVGDLCDLLSTRGSSQEQEQSKELKPRLPLPSSVTAVNEASKGLGTGLENAWTCLNTRHDGHNAVLRFDAQLDMEDNVHMNVAISCRPSNTSSPQTYVPILDLRNHCLQYSDPTKDTFGSMSKALRRPIVNTKNTNE
jgi:hypothetical protein